MDQSMMGTGKDSFTRKLGYCLLPCSLALSHLTASPATGQKPNLLLLVAEDMGPHLGCYGDSTVPTPNLDRLANAGIRFTHAYVSQASCSPSRSTILTGLYPHTNNQLGLAHLGYRMHNGIPSLPTLLKKAGYRTGIIGKLHVKPESAFAFDFHAKPARPKSKDPTVYPGLVQKFLRQTGESPFFLMVNFADVHLPFHQQVNGHPTHPLLPNQVKPWPEYAGGGLPDKLKARMAGYYNGVQRVDTAVGGVLEVLRRHQLEQRTIVVFIGDHGPDLPYAKMTCFELGTRIPFIVQWPGMKQGVVRNELISTIDIAPAFLRAAGIRVPREFPGRDFAPLCAGDNAPPWRQYLFTEWNAHGPERCFPQRAVRDNRYKLILTPVPGPYLNPPGLAGDKGKNRWFKSWPRVLLFDLQTDPAETKNLAESTQYQAVRERLLAALEQWRKATADYSDAELRKLIAYHREQARQANTSRLRKIDMGPWTRSWDGIRGKLEVTP